jgi:serine phosphatase RsbU (regulator of sigma subunit)/anti-sigma regulatory factor (Ser/Thr protein kinase)
VSTPQDNGISKPAALRLEVPCDLAQVRPAAKQVADFLASQGCTKDDITPCGIALVEACNNAIKYAPSESTSLPIRIQALVTDDAVELGVTDHTLGFEWPAQAKLPAQESESGRGLYLIRSVTSQASYLRGQGENLLVFTCRRTAPAVLAPVAAPAPDLQARLSENQAVMARMVEELSACYESLSAIFQHIGPIHDSDSLELFGRRLLKDLLQIVGADWYVLRFASPARVELRVFTASHAALELGPLPLVGAEVRAHCAEVEAALTLREVWFDLRQTGAGVDLLARAHPGAQGIVHPLCAGDELVGTLAVGRNATETGPAATGDDTVFTAGQAGVIRTLADFFAIQAVNIRQQEEATQTRIVARELDIANNIQRSLLPKAIPHIPGVSIGAYCENARRVGGDFYDVLQVNDSSLLAIIADVMGKGVPAALFAAILRTAFRAAPELLHQPGALLARANALLFEELSGVDMFITAQLALLDTRHRKLTLANAGHCPLLLWTPEAPAFAALSPEGMPLGVEADGVFREQTLPLTERFRLLLYTDGITDAQNGESRRFGQENLELWFATAAAQCRTAEALKTALVAEIHQFRGDQPLNDDQTFLTLASHDAS